MRKIKILFLATLMVIMCVGMSALHAEEIVWVIKDSKMPTGRTNNVEAVVTLSAAVTSNEPESGTGKGDKST